MFSLFGFVHCFVVLNLSPHAYMIHHSAVSSALFVDLFKPRASKLHFQLALVGSKLCTNSQELLVVSFGIIPINDVSRNPTNDLKIPLGHLLNDSEGIGTCHKPTWWEERTNFQNLSCDLHTSLGVCACIHSQ